MKAIHAKYSQRKLDRIHLQIVREVERQGSMTAAAANLHLTQSALSHAMRKLERSLGAELWLREGRRLVPTDAGQHLLDVANHVLPQLEHAETSLKQMARGTRGTLRIGMECHPCYQWLLKVVSQYLPQWPDVAVDVKQRFRFGGISALLDHEIDLRSRQIRNHDRVYCLSRSLTMSRCWWSRARIRWRALDTWNLSSSQTKR